MERFLKILFLCLIIIFTFGHFGGFGIGNTWAEQKKDYKKGYKENERASKKTPATKKNQWIPFTRAVKNKDDVNMIPKNSYLRKDILRGRTPSEEKYKKDVGIKPDSKKKWLATGEVKTGKHGVKESDIKGKGLGTKPGAHQYKMLDTRRSKDIKIDNVKRLQ